MISLVGLSLLGVSFQRRSSVLLREVESAKTLQEQIAAFNRINRHGGYRVRLFTAAGPELDYDNPGAEEVSEVEIDFQDGNRVRTLLVKPGVWGNLLNE